MREGAAVGLWARRVTRFALTCQRTAHLAGIAVSGVHRVRSAFISLAQAFNVRCEVGLFYLLCVVARGSGFMSYFFANAVRKMNELSIELR